MSKSQANAMLDSFLRALDEPEAIKDGLKDYFEDISVMAANEVGIQFKNKGAHHAAIVMANIFNYATDNVKMFAGNFNGDISDTSIYLASLEAFIKEGGSLDIIFEQAPNPGSKALRLIKSYQQQAAYKHNITIKMATPEAIQAYKARFKDTHQTMIHFAVGDEKMYRCELDVVTYKALCNLDDRLLAGQLLDFHEALSKDAIVI
jgi:hypothetical protein